jgi:transcriptional regulator with XRE-family HTH domain
MADIFLHIMSIAELEPIATVIKVARENKGFSQRALGERVGIPQSHISKIESGAVDLQTSSLMQIARALDLELILIPRTALPAVQALNAVRPPEESLLAPQIRRELIPLSKWTKALARRYPKVRAVERLMQTIAEVELLRFVMSKEQVREILRAIDALRGPIRQLYSAPRPARQVAPKLLAEIEDHERVLRDIRNSLAHGKNAPAPPTPAYQLGDDEELEEESTSG